MDNLFNKGYAVPCDSTAQLCCLLVPTTLCRTESEQTRQAATYVRRSAQEPGRELVRPAAAGPGPTAILFRFVEKPIAVTADIQEMFLQLKIRPDDQPT